MSKFEQYVGLWLLIGGSYGISWLAMIQPSPLMVLLAVAAWAVTYGYWLARREV